MKAPLSWLKDHLETSLDISNICATLGQLGLVVDDVYDPGKLIKNFLIVEVIDVSPHPQADRLQICQVCTGTDTLQVVCGAPNVRKGMKTVLGQPGDYVPGLGVTLKKAKIRTIESMGMLCSGTELGIPSAVDGILDLPLTAPVGESIARYLNLDPVLTIDVTPNRGDCLSMRGIARDLSAAGAGVLRPLVPAIPMTNGPCSLPVTRLENAVEACPYFMGRIIKHVKNGPSPDWLQQKLRSVGLKPISLLVDITNFMAFDRGRPMHVFDADKFTGSLTIRMAKDNEVIHTLDDKTHTLASSMVVVADDKGPQAIAGIMGSMSSGCTLETTTVFLESAYFNKDSIAATGQKLGLISESRSRFERGVDPCLVSDVLDEATCMILDLCGGEASDTITLGHEPTRSSSIHFDMKTLETQGGLHLPPQDIECILEKLGFKWEKISSTMLHIIVPSWRWDVTGPHDIIEDILRLKGYDAIPVVPLPASTQEEVFPVSLSIKTRRQNQWCARRLLGSRGMHEIITWSFVNENDARLFAPIQPNFILSNPMSVDLSTMRPTLVGSLAKALQRNKDKGTLPLGLFEVAPVYHHTLPQGQQWTVGGIRPGYGYKRHWRHPQRSATVYDIKADVMALVGAFGIQKRKIKITEKAPDYYHPGQCATVSVSKNTVAHMGAMHPKIAQALGVEGPVYIFEVFLEAIMPTPKSSYTSVALQPVERDLAFIVDEDVPASLLLSTLEKVNPRLIVDADIFDVYRGQGVGTGKKSVGLWYTMQPQDKSLTDAQIHETMQAIITAIEHATKGTLRA